MTEELLEPATRSVTRSDDLPRPEQLPGADVVIFDGQCVFCRGQVERLRRWDGKGRLAFLSLHDEAVARRYADLTHEQLMREMVVVDRRGNRHAGADAIRYLSRRLPRLWLLAPLLHFPGTMWLWRRLYQFVAQRRYRLRGKTTCDGGTCHLH